jgi:hypothetical protein
MWGPSLQFLAAPPQTALLFGRLSVAIIGIAIPDRPENGSTALPKYFNYL